MASQPLEGSLEPADVAVVFGAPHVDLASEAALALVLVICDVGGQVGVLAARAHQHSILVVTELRRAQPQRALAAIRASLALELRQRPVDRAWLARVELALKGEAVEFEHVHGLERALHLREQLADGRTADLGWG